MENIFKTLEDGYIVYKSNIINVIIDNNDVIWFNAKQTANALGYINHINAINMHTQKKDRLQLQYIKYDNKIKEHPHSLYVNEAGLYKLILRSRLYAAEKFTNWVTYDVLPSIRKFGYYKLSEEYKETVKTLNTKIKRLSTMKKNADNEIAILKQNLKKEKFPKGGLVYAIDFSTNKKEIYRVGMTSNMNKRKEVINSHTLNKLPVAHYIEIKCPRALESCIRALLYPFRYRDKADFFVCSLKRVKYAFTSCISGNKKIISCESNPKDKNQYGGSITLIDTDIITNEIDNIINLRDKLLIKINKLNKKIYNM